MAHVARCKAAKRLQLEQLESRLLLSADFPDYRPEMSVHPEHEGPSGGSPSAVPFAESQFAPPRRTEYSPWSFPGEYDSRLSSLSYHSPMNSQDTSYVDENRISQALAPDSPAKQSFTAPSPITVTTVVMIVTQQSKQSIYGPPAPTLSNSYLAASSYFRSAFQPATTANLADAKAQLDASRTSVSASTSRTSLEKSSTALDTAFAKYSNPRVAADVQKTPAGIDREKDDALPAAKRDADGDGGLAERGTTSEAQSTQNSMSADARRAAVDAALRELSRMRDRGNMSAPFNKSGKLQHRNKRTDKAAADQEDAKPVAQDFAAGMVLLRAEADVEIAISADRLPQARPAIKAMIGAYRALDLGTDQAPAQPPALPAAQTPTVGQDALSGGAQEREVKPGRGATSRIAGAARAAGAVTLAVRHEFFSDRKKRRLQPPR
jgi:hypothetical protein